MTESVLKIAHALQGASTSFLSISTLRGGPSATANEWRLAEKDLRTHLPLGFILSPSSRAADESDVSSFIFGEERAARAAPPYCSGTANLSRNMARPGCLHCIFISVA